MPIRLNLLAEAQELEELRRRDPVKRAIWGSALAIIAVLVWSSTLWAKAFILTSETSRIEAELKSREATFSKVTDNEKQVREIQQKLASLNQLATNRYLNGNLLQALQQATADNVQLTRIRTEHNYVLTEEVKPARGSRTVPKPATVTERITLTLEAKDTGATPGDSVTPFKDTLAAHAYFLSSLGSNNELRLKDWRPPERGTDGGTFMLFALECKYPEKTR